MGKHTSNQANTAKRKVLPSLRVIEKPGEGEYPTYAHIYIDLLPDDGLILQHLEDHFKSTKKFVASIPKARLLIAMPKENGPSRRSLGTLWMMSASTFTGRCGLRGTILLNFQDSTKTTTPNTLERTSGTSRIF